MITVNQYKTDICYLCELMVMVIDAIPDEIYNAHTRHTTSNGSKKRLLLDNLEKTHSRVAAMSDDELIKAV